MDHFFQAWLVDGNLTSLQCLDLACVVIDADHVVADVGKAGAGHETDISGANNREIHREQGETAALGAEKQPTSHQSKR